MIYLGVFILLLMLCLLCPLAGEIRIAFVLYKHIGIYLSTENASMKLGSDAMATNYSVIVNSPVITAAINKDSNKVYLSDPVIFTIRHLQVTQASVCVCVNLRVDTFTLTLAPDMPFVSFPFVYSKIHLPMRFLDSTSDPNFLYPRGATKNKSETEKIK